MLRVALRYGVVDFSILEGIRTPERQRKLKRQGKSKTLNSKHLVQSDGYGHAVDVIAYPIQWNNDGRNFMLAGYLIGVATSLGVGVRSGADWNRDFRHKSWKSWLKRRKKIFNDLVHLELAE